MFKCQITNKMSRRGDPRTGAYTYIDEKSGEDSHSSEKVHRIVIQTRERVYKQRVFNETTRQAEEVIVGRGSEISMEISCTEEGKNIWDAWNQAERDTFVKKLKEPKR